MKAGLFIPTKKKYLPEIKMNNRGILGLDVVRSVIVFFLIMAVTAIAVFLALVSLQNSGIFPTGSQSANNTNLIINNITQGTTQFFGNVPTIFVVLGAVVIILAVTLIIAAVYRFGSDAGSGSGSL